MSSSDDFFKGLVFGAVIGATAGILLAPKSGEETREDLKSLALDMGDKATEAYKDARRSIRRKMRELKEAGKNIDIDTYKRLVSKVVDEVKEDRMVSNDVAKKLGEQLNEDWNELKDSILA